MKQYCVQLAFSGREVLDLRGEQTDTVGVFYVDTARNKR